MFVMKKVKGPPKRELGRGTLKRWGERPANYPTQAKRRLEWATRGHTFALANQIFIFGHGELDVCDGGHWLNVMNEWEVLEMKIRPPAAQSGVERGRRFGRPPFGYPPRLRSGLRQNRASFLEKRENWRTRHKGDFST